MNSWFSNPKTTIALTCVQPVRAVPGSQLQSQPVPQTNIAARFVLPQPSTVSTPDDKRVYGQSMCKSNEEPWKQTTSFSPWISSNARNSDNGHLHLPGRGGGGHVQSSQSATSESTFSRHAVGIKETKQEYKFQYLHPSFYMCLTCSKAFNAPKSLQRHLWEHIQKDVGFSPPNVHYPLEVEMQYHIEQHVNKLRQLSDEFSETINAHLLVHLDRDLCRLSMIFSGGAPRSVNQASFCLIHHVVVVVSNRGVALSDLLTDNMLLPCSSPTEQDVLSYCCTFNPPFRSNKFQCGTCPATFNTADSMNIAAHVCRHLRSSQDKARFVTNCIVHFLQKIAQLPVASTRAVNGSIEMKFAKRFRGFSILTVFEILDTASHLEPVKISSYVSEVLLHTQNGSERSVSPNNGSSKIVSQNLISNHPMDILKDKTLGPDADFSKHQLSEDMKPERALDHCTYVCTKDFSSEQGQKVTKPNNLVNSTAAESTIEALKEKLRTDQELSGNDKAYTITVDNGSEEVQKATQPDSIVNPTAAESTNEALKEKLRTDQELSGNDKGYTITVDSGYFPQDKGTGISVELSVRDGCSTLPHSSFVSKANRTEIFAEISSFEGRSTARISSSQSVAQSTEISFEHSFDRDTSASKDRSVADCIIPRDRDVMSQDYVINDPFTDVLDVKPQLEQTGFYKCGFPGCLFSCLNPDGLVSHIDKNHIGQSTFSCFLCGKEYRDGRLLSSHLTHNHIGTNRKRESRDMVFNCHVLACAFKSNLLERYIRHYQALHSSLRVYHCFHCAAKFPSIDSLNTHLFMSLKCVYRCTYCLVRSFNRTDLLSHMSDVHASQKDQNIFSVTYLSCINPSWRGKCTVLLAETNPSEFLQTKDIPSGQNSSETSSSIQSAPSQDCGDSMTPGSEETACTDKETCTVTEKHDCPIGCSWMNEALSNFIKESRSHLICVICSHSFKVVRLTMDEYKPIHQHILSHLNLNIHRCHLCSFECITCFSLQVHFRNAHSEYKGITNDNVLYKNGLQFKSALTNAVNLLTLGQSPKKTPNNTGESHIAKKALLSPKYTCNFCHSFSSRYRYKVRNHISTSRHPRMMCCTYCGYRAGNIPEMSKHITETHSGSVSFRFVNPFEYITRIDKTTPKVEEDNHSSSTMNQISTMNVADKDNTLHCKVNPAASSIDVIKNLVLKETKKLSDRHKDSSQSAFLYSHNMSSQRPVITKDPSKLREIRPCSELFRCEQCTFRCKLLADMDRHIVHKHPDSRLSCDLCGDINYSSFRDLSCAHSGNLHRNCLFSHPVFSQNHSEDSRTPDIDTGKYKQFYKCQLCTYKKTCLKSLSSHIIKVHPSMKVICSLCNGSTLFNSLTSLVLHHRIYHRFKPLSYKLSHTAGGEDNSVDAAQTLKCLLCPVEINDLYALDKHIRESHSRADIICGHCSDGETFPSVTRLFWKHHGEHHGELPLQYWLELPPDDCGKSTVNDIVTKTTKKHTERFHRRKQKRRLGRRKCSLNSYKIYFSSSESEDFSDDSSETDSVLTVTDEDSSETDTASDQDSTSLVGDHTNSLVGYRRRRSTRQRVSIKWICMGCDFTSATLLPLQEHLKRADHRCPSYCGKKLENLSLQGEEEAPKDKAFMKDAYINLAWTQEQIEDKGLTYCCHLCSFETRDLLEFQEHFCLHNLVNLSDNYSDCGSATDSDGSVLNENDFKSEETASCDDDTSDESASDSTCSVASEFSEYGTKRTRVLSKACRTNNNGLHLSSQSDINSADSNNDYLQETVKSDSFEHSFRVSPRSSANKIDGRRKDTHVCALCNFRGDSHDDIYKHIIETHVRECQTESQSSECVVEESHEKDGASNISPDLSGNLIASVPKTSQIAMYKCPFCPVTCVYDKLVHHHMVNEHLIPGEGISAKSDSGDILVDKTAVVRVRDVMKLSDDELDTLLDDYGVKMLDMTFPERSHSDVTQSSESCSSQGNKRKRIYGAYDTYWRILNKKFGYLEHTRKRRKKVLSLPVKHEDICDSVEEDPNDTRKCDTLMEADTKISERRSPVNSSGKTSNTVSKMENIRFLKSLPWSEEKCKLLGESLFVNSNDGNADFFADTSGNGGGLHKFSTRGTVCNFSDDDSCSSDAGENANGESASEDICVEVQLDCDDTVDDDNMANQYVLVEDGRGRDSTINTFSGQNPVCDNTSFNLSAPTKSEISFDDDSGNLGVVVKMETHDSASDDRTSDDATEVSRMKAHFAEIAQYINP